MTRQRAVARVLGHERSKARLGAAAHLAAEETEELGGEGKEDGNGDMAEADADAGVHVGGDDKGLGFRAAAACDKQQHVISSSSSKQAAAAAAASSSSSSSKQAASSSKQSSKLPAAAVQQTEIMY